MRESFLFGRMEKIQKELLQHVENCPKDKLTLIPDGFSNSVLWHLGHVLTITERVVFGLAGEPRTLPESYTAFFEKGTKPADWTEEPPACETLIEQLKEQENRIKEVFFGKFNAPVKENPFKAETVVEVLESNLIHVGVHTGNIGAMVKLLKQW